MCLNAHYRVKDHTSSYKVQLELVLYELVNFFHSWGRDVNPSFPGDISSVEGAQSVEVSGGTWTSGQWTVYTAQYERLTTMSQEDTKVDHSESAGGFSLADLEIHKTIGTGGWTTRVKCRAIIPVFNNARNIRLGETL